jgi:hypothetical protein
MSWEPGININAILSLTLLTLEDVCEVYPDRSSDSWFILLSAPSHLEVVANSADFVPTYSGGAVPDSHGIPY